MREAKVRLGSSEFTVAMPLGALDDLEKCGVDVIKLVTGAAAGRDGMSFVVVRHIVDVAGAWGEDPERGRPGKDAGALTFATVYADENFGGLMKAIEIAQVAIQLPFKGGDEENPTGGGETA